MVRKGSQSSRRNAKMEPGQHTGKMHGWESTKLTVSLDAVPSALRHEDANMPDFMPGLELSRLYFEEWVQPALAAEFPAVRYDAAVIGTGSEVLGFDTPMSRDHHWGPRVSLYVSPDDVDTVREPIREYFRHHLPYEFRGYPTSFEDIPGEPGTLRFETKTSGPVNHRIEVTTLHHMLGWYLDFDWQREAQVSVTDWLTIPQQKLRTLVAGAVYHTGLGDLPAMREQFAWYPHDVWLYLLAAGWSRISQEEAFVGRTGDVGDEVGSRLIAGRLVRDMMMLCFLMEKQYAPYPKWFGTGFAQLECSAPLTPVFEQVLAAQDWRTREAHMAEAYRLVATMHNALDITEPLSTTVSDYHSRGYQVIHGDHFADAIRAVIQDEDVRRIAQERPIGSIDQYSDSTDLREGASLRQRLRRLYD